MYDKTTKTILISLFLSVPAWAQPNAAAPNYYGDRQSGHFGDPNPGYFGDPSAGEFQRYNYRRDQEGSIAPSPAIPLRGPGAASAAPVEESPYIVLPPAAVERSSKPKPKP